MSEQAHKGPRTFQVTIPSGSPEQILALDGLADAFHWEIRDSNDRTVVDLPEIPEDTLLTEADFLLASQELWSTDTHGKVAHSMLHNVRSAVASGGHVSVGWAGGVGDISLYINDTPFSHSSHVPVGDKTMDPKIVDARVMREIEGRNLPFGVVMQRPDPSSNRSYHRNIFIPSLLDKSRLAKYLVHRGYDRHQYHEAVGKAVDVMLAVAEVEPVSKHNRTLDIEYVDRKDVVAMMVANGTTRPQADGLFKIVRTVVKSQLALSSEHNDEVVVAGSIEPYGWSEIKLIDRIAVDSIKHLKPLSTNTRVSEIIDDLDWNLTQWREAQASSAQ